MKKKLGNITKTLSLKDKEIYHLNIEIENHKSLSEKEIASLNEKILIEKLEYEKEVERLQQKNCCNSK